MNKFPIQLTPTLRIIDFDKHQYVIQRLKMNKGEETWHNSSYCATLEGLVRTCREEVGAYYAREARQKFNDNGLPELLMKLPPKTGK